LRRFEIPLNGRRRLFGVFLASHAIPDALNFLHSGAGCKPKTQRQLALHDRAMDAQKKHVWTDISDAHVISGSAARLRDMFVETARRRGRPGVAIITASTAMQMTGIDFDSVISELKPLNICPIAHVRTSEHEGDMFDGYMDAVKAVMDFARWEETPANSASVNVIGYIFDRYEQDHAANLHEMKRLLSGAGVSTNTVYLSGAPFSDLMSAPKARMNALLPYARPLEKWAVKRTRRPGVMVELPLGVAGTAMFVEEIARAAGVPAADAGGFVERERERLRPRLKAAREWLEGMRAAVFADTPSAAGLASLLADLGMRTTLVGLMDRTLGGAAEFRRTLGRLGTVLEGDPDVLKDPTAEDVRRAFETLKERIGGRPADVVISPDLPFSGGIGDLPRLELGFPSNRKRALYPCHTLGFNGVTALSQRLLDTVAGVH
jgi:nitrogenase molybdenum-iron protein alpha/beta subunit